MSFKIAFIGAGSIEFTRKLIQDIFSVSKFSNLQIVLMDINAQNLNMIYQLIIKDLKSNRRTAVSVMKTTDQKEAVTDAKYIINCARVGGLEAFKYDIDIPLRYGIDQCVGDTLCAGGIMYGQRGIPMIMNLCRDIKTLAKKDALLLNYANPNAMLTWAANHYGGVNTVGLCHGVQGGHAQIANALKIPIADLDIICAGINHQTWYIKVEHNGIDQSGNILEAYEKDPDLKDQEKVRIDMLKRFGYFSTESNGHLSEYVPWYRKRADEISDWISMESWIHGETGGYYRYCSEKRNWFETDFPKWLAEDSPEYLPENRSAEHGSYIIEGLETGWIYRGHFNVVNNGVLTNLPEDSVIEVPGYVDRLGIHIPFIGDLPLGPAAVCNNSISVQRLAVSAAVNGDDLQLRQAMMLDPLTGAVCNPPEIWQMVDEFLAAQEQWLPQYSTAADAAKKRIANGLTVKVQENNKGAARKDITYSA